jgi:uncharacterized protein (TIGR03086 family)
MDPFEALERAAIGFETRLKAVSMDQWSLPTPCPPWTVRQLAAHVVAGNRMAALLLAGASAREAAAVLGEDPLGADPVGAFLSSAAEQEAAFAEPGALERNCHHMSGDISGARLLGYRVTDLVVHAWDLARATKSKEELDPELVQEIWQALAPVAPMIADTGYFGSGPSGLVDAEAPLQDRLLDLTGRRP